MTNLTEEEKDFFRREIFKERPQEACQDCGGIHFGICPRIRRLVLVGEGQSVGNRVEVEYWPQGQYDDSDTIYPGDVWSEEKAVE